MFQGTFLMRAVADVLNVSSRHSKMSSSLAVFSC